ncbi:TPA: glycosyl transferase [Candidatus Sumerlaeota bacterium]|nr:glycosyl transferase [Candidatus Sumerlaeota bacterium]
MPSLPSNAPAILIPRKESAFRLFTLPQKIFWTLCLLLLIGGIYHNGKTGLIWLNAGLTFIYLAVTFYKMVMITLSAAGGKQHHPDMLLAHEPPSPHQPDLSNNEDWPAYTVLVPLFRETEVLPKLVENLSRLDYPKEKLQIILLLESVDKETVAAAEAMNLQAPFFTLVVPDSYPRTKPKACNVALPVSTGEYLVIFDAEDRPEPDQLKKAITAFREAPDNVICQQARLNFYNRDHNLLTKWFTVDYSTWFDLYLPGLALSDAPIPLGGTSNHFKLAALRKLGGWDAFNVAEDCDLGMRLYKKGYRTQVIDSTTWEEACSHPGFWIKQRSRWVKGYIQTFFVHTRNPWSSFRALGLTRTLHFLALTAGLFFPCLINPFYWVLTALWVAYRPAEVGAYFPTPIFIMGFICLFLGNFALIYLGMLGCCARRYYDLVKWALLLPPYWAMVSIASWKAAWQLIVKPHYWEKTKHGLSSDKEPPAPKKTPETADATMESV